MAAREMELLQQQSGNGLQTEDSKKETQSEGRSKIIENRVCQC